MLNNINYLDRLKNYKNVKLLLNDAYLMSDNLFSRELKYLKVDDYEYDSDIACEELGLDRNLISHLVEDYIKQIFNIQTTFLDHINKLKEDKEAKKELDYTEFRELSHKILGVARNLRIEVAEKILFRMMRSDDLDSMLKYLEALIATTIILNPEYSYKEINLKRKESL